MHWEKKINALHPSVAPCLTVTLKKYILGVLLHRSALPFKMRDVWPISSVTLNISTVQFHSIPHFVPQGQLDFKRLHVCRTKQAWVEARGSLWPPHSFMKELLCERGYRFLFNTKLKCYFNKSNLDYFSLSPCKITRVVNAEPDWTVILFTYFVIE